jgi:hypothetical protein
MSLVDGRDGWEIVGPERDKARLAYAVVQGDQLVYDIPEPSLTVLVRLRRTSGPDKSSDYVTPLRRLTTTRGPA